MIVTNNNVKLIRVELPLDFCIINHRLHFLCDVAKRFCTFYNITLNSLLTLGHYFIIYEISGMSTWPKYLFFEHHPYLIYPLTWKCSYTTISVFNLQTAQPYVYLINVFFFIVSICTCCSLNNLIPFQLVDITANVVRELYRRAHWRSINPQASVTQKCRLARSGLNWCNFLYTDSSNWRSEHPREPPLKKISSIQLFIPTSCAKYNIRQISSDHF